MLLFATTVHPSPITAVRWLLSLGVLLAVFGGHLAITELAATPPARVPPLAAGAQARVEDDPGAITDPGCREGSPGLGGSCIVVGPAHEKPGSVLTAQAPVQDERQFFAQMAVTKESAAPINPKLDQSRDRRADLMAMAISIRWHRGTASGLPPGSD